MASIGGSSVSKCVRVISLWLCLLSLSSRVIAQENGDDDGTEQPSTEPTTPEPFNIALLQKERATSSLTIGWRVPNGYNVHQYEVRSSKSESNATTYSGPIDAEEKEYLISDLAVNTKYEVCVKVHVKLEENDDVTQEEVCDDVSTIPIIMAKSLIILFGVLAYIVLMIVIGYCVWKRALKKALAGQEDKEEEEEKIQPNQEPQTYLAPPNPNAPKSSIEDHDIPYITPPVEQLSPKEKDQYKKALV